jgi:hypothetical protein
VSGFSCPHWVQNGMGGASGRGGVRGSLGGRG